MAGAVYTAPAIVHFSDFFFCFIGAVFTQFLRGQGTAKDAGG